MQEKTRGIVLHALKYADSGQIVTVYTERFGRVSYAVYGAGRKKSACPPALLQPLSVVELDVEHRPGRDLQRIREMRVAMPVGQIPMHPVKSSIALFLAEVLYRTLRLTEADGQLYRFLEHSVAVLDGCGEGMAGFHLLFLVKLTHYLGCEPNIERETRGYFDLQNGVFSLSRPPHAHYLLPEVACDLLPLLVADYGMLEELPPLSRRRRGELLEGIIEYYRLHIPGFGGINSLDVLHCLFD